jgi:Kef-type K+ transport system membrane component KefB
MKTKEIYQYVLGALIVLTFFTVGILLILFPIPSGSESSVNNWLGVTFTAFTFVVGFFFGSSLGSARKTEIMANNEKDLGQL